MRRRALKFSPGSATTHPFVNKLVVPFFLTNTVKVNRRPRGSRVVFLGKRPELRLSLEFTSKKLNTFLSSGGFLGSDYQPDKVHALGRFSSFTVRRLQLANYAITRAENWDTDPQKVGLAIGRARVGVFRKKLDVLPVVPFACFSKQTTQLLGSKAQPLISIFGYCRRTASSFGLGGNSYTYFGTRLRGNMAKQNKKHCRADQMIKGTPDFTETVSRSIRARKLQYDNFLMHTEQDYNFAIKPRFYSKRWAARYLSRG